MNLSKNFTLKEMTMSTTAMRLGIDNEPSLDVVVNLMKLANNVLQPLRDHMKQSIRINSGYRSEELNKRVGGSKTSQHCKGEAADISCDGRNTEMFNYIKDNLGFDQLIWEYGDMSTPDWVHVSYREGANRGDVLIAKRKNGKTVYEKYGG